MADIKNVKACASPLLGMNTQASRETALGKLTRIVESKGRAHEEAAELLDWLNHQTPPPKLADELLWRLLRDIDHR